MKKGTSPLLLGAYLLMFLVLTSLGYVTYEVFLAGTKPQTLLLTTFLCLFVWRTFDGWVPFARSPLQFNNISFDTYHLGHAFFLFAYWFLFWFGITSLPQDNSAAALAVSVLALNAIAMPVANKIAHKQKMGFRGWSRQFIVASAIMICVVMMQFGVSSDDIYAWLAMVEGSLGRELPGIDFLEETDVGQVEIGQKYVIGITCLFLAVFFEAIADFLNGRREYESTTGVGAMTKQSDQSNYLIHLVKKWYKKNGMLAVVDCLLREVKFAIEENQFDKEKIDETKAPDLKQRLGVEEARLEELHGRLLAVAERLRNGQFSPRKERAIRAEFQDELLTDFLPFAGEVVRNDLHPELRYLKENGAEQRSADVVAVVGLFVSLLLFVGLGSEIEFDFSLKGVAFIVPLALMGFSGVIARIAFVEPIVVAEPENAKLVPPLYASRPLLLLLVFLLLQWAFGNQKGVIWGIWEYDLTHETPMNVGWYIGAISATALAIVLLLDRVTKLRDANQSSG